MAMATRIPAQLTSAPDNATKPATPDWIVAVSPSEIASGQLAPHTESAAHAAFDEHGCVLLRGALAPAIVEAMHREYAAQAGVLDLVQMRDQAAKSGPNWLSQVGNARYDVTLRMTGALGQAEVFANPLLLKFLRPLLGADMHLNSFTAVVSHPGATQQRAHRDYPHLYFEPGVGLNLPVHAVNVVVPLVDVDLETGPTGVWLGSHRSGDTAQQIESLTVCALQRGDCMLMDYRTLHAGLPNRTGLARPIVYMVYARPWFFDQQNHVRSSRVPLDMPLEHYNGLPVSVRPLLSRAFYYAMLSHRREVEPRGPAVERPAENPPAAGNFGRVGRNDPCPCGAGKKYKHCHGSLEAPRALSA
jgi:ectoine hydroxylase-related dioxygenase (phytanoyl-CoA dioxygenase family)